MSTDTVTPESTETPATETLAPVQSTNADLFSVAREMITQSTTSANEIADLVQAKRVNVGKAIQEIRETVEIDDEKILKFREWLAKLDARREEQITEINEYIKANHVAASEMSDADFEAAKERYKTLKGEVTSTIALAKKMPGYEEGKLEGIPELKVLASVASSATGTGPARPRLASATVDGTEIWSKRIIKTGDHKGDTEQFVTFTVIAAHLSTKKTTVKPGELAAIAIDAVGSKDLSTVTDVEFAYSVDGTNHMIRVFPAQSSK